MSNQPYGPGRDVSQLGLFKGHITTRMPKPTGDLKGRVAMITGATSGLGFEAALHFARLNASTIVFAVRNPDKAKAYTEKLYKQVPSFRGEVKTLALDLSSFESVRSFAKELETAVPRLDFAVLNAGVFNTKHTMTKEGWLADIQVNVLSTGLLGLLLLPKLQATAKLPQPAGATPAVLKPQLHIVASEVHWLLQRKTHQRLVDADNLLETVCSREFWDSTPFNEIYNLGKLFDIMLARKIGALPAAQGVQVTSSSPGLCKSNLTGEFNPIVAWFITAISWRGEFGTRNYMIAMLQPHPQGTFIFEGVEHPTSKFSCSPEGVRVEGKLWEESSRVWRDVAPEVDAVLR